MPCKGLFILTFSVQLSALHLQIAASIPAPGLQVSQGGARAADLRRAQREEEQQRSRGQANQVDPDLEVGIKMSFYVGLLLL